MKNQKLVSVSFFVFGLSILSVLSACGKPVEEPKISAVSQENTVADQSATDFYNSLKFSKSGDCTKGLSFTKLITDTSVVVGTSNQYKDIVERIYVYLLDENKYVASYVRAEVLKRYPNNQDDTKIIAWKNQEGTWSIEGSEIVLSDLGRGTGRVEDKENVIEFRFEGKFAGALSGSTYTLRSRTGRSSYKPYSEYCPKQN